jgi:hypothetical protein
MSPHVMGCSQLCKLWAAQYAWNRYNSKKSKQTSCHAMPKIIRSGRPDRYPQVILLQGLSRRTGSLTVYPDKPQKAIFITRSSITQTLVPQVPQSTFFKKISKKRVTRADVQKSSRGLSPSYGRLYSTDRTTVHV